MKLLVLLVGVVAVTQAVVPIYSTTAYNYHETIGIPAAQRIKQGEAALDFDGSRIIGGSPSSLGAQPHLGGLVISLVDGRQSVCGSSLLSNTRALTAAHCWFDGWNQARDFMLVLGSLTLFSGGTRVVTSDVRMHENWTWNPIHNDIAIISLVHVGFNNNIRPIGLASGSNQYVGTWATAAGYGLTSDSQSNVPTNTVKKHVNLQVINNDDCRRVFGVSVIASTICTTGDGTVGTCRGDSGGPLAIGSGNSRTLIGVTSFGSRSCEAGHPSAFSRITSFNSWIRARL